MYAIRSYYELENVGNMIVDHQGDGGYNEFYFGTAFELSPYASVGMNAAYLFGTLNRDRLVDDPDATVAGTWVNEEFTASDFHYRVGAQYYPKFTSKKDISHQIILGASYEIGSDINLKYSSMTSRRFPSQSSKAAVDTFNVIEDSLTYLNLPAKLALGVSYIYDERLLLSLV